MELYPIAKLFKAQTLRAFARQTHRSISRGGRRGSARLGEIARFASECSYPGECSRIDDLHEDGCSPVIGFVSSAKTSKCAGQRFNQKAERESFVSQILSAERHDRSGRFCVEHTWIVSGIA